jgi:hypothetical protein
MEAEKFDKHHFSQNPFIGAIAPCHMRCWDRFKCLISGPSFPSPYLPLSASQILAGRLIPDRIAIDKSGANLAATTLAGIETANMIRKG